MAGRVVRRALASGLLLSLCCIATGQFIEPLLEIPRPTSLTDEVLKFGRRAQLDPLNPLTLVTNAFEELYDATEPAAKTYIYEIDPEKKEAELVFTLNGFGDCVDIYNGTVLTTSPNGTVAFIEKTADGWELASSLVVIPDVKIGERFGFVCAAGPGRYVVTYLELKPPSEGGGDTSDIWVTRDGDGEFACIGKDGKCTKNQIALILDTFSHFVLDADGDLLVWSLSDSEIDLGPIKLDKAAGTITYTPYLEVVTEDSGTQGYERADIANGTLVVNSALYRGISKSKIPDPQSWSSEEMGVGDFMQVNTYKALRIAAVFGFLETGNDRISEIVAQEFNDQGQVTQSFNLVNAKGKEAGVYEGGISHLTFAGSEYVAISTYFPLFPDNEQKVVVWRLPPPGTATGTLRPTASPTPAPTAIPTEVSHTPAPTATPEPTDIPVACFSAESVVSVLRPDGSSERVTLDQVKRGDHVEAFDTRGQRVYTEVALVQHEGTTASVDLLNVEYRQPTGEFSEFHVSRGHYLMKGLQPMELVLSNALEVGDKLLVTDAKGHPMEAEVSRISSTRKAVRNVVTMSDKLIVDNVLATTYTDVLHLSPRIQKVLTLPLKILYSVGLGGLAARLDSAVHSAVVACD